MIIHVPGSCHSLSQGPVCIVKLFTSGSHRISLHSCHRRNVDAVPWPLLDSSRYFFWSRGVLPDLELVSVPAWPHSIKERQEKHVMESVSFLSHTNTRGVNGDGVIMDTRTYAELPLARPSPCFFLFLLVGLWRIIHEPAEDKRGVHYAVLPG